MAPPMAPGYMALAPAEEVALAADDTAEADLLPAELVTLAACELAELVMLEPALIKLAYWELRDDWAEPVAVARTELTEATLESIREAPEDREEPMLERAELPAETAELATDEPDARALEMPLETAEAAELADVAAEPVKVDWALATAPRAATKKIE